MIEVVIRTRQLTHRFGATTAVDQVDLAVSQGEIYGFLGRNGAGKTTLIRALLGLITPTAGEVRLFGTPVRGGRTPPALWARVGYLVEGPGLYARLTVLEHASIVARYRNLPATAIADVLTRLDLERYAHVRAGALSLGNRQRLALALALVHRPPLLVLDEPVNGLDPAGVVEIRNLLRHLTDEGVTVFMSTHIIGEVARLADRVGIIHNGRLIHELSSQQLAQTGQERLVSTFHNADLARQAVAALRAQGTDAYVDGKTVIAIGPAAIAAPDLVATQLVQAGTAPTSLTVQREDLEQQFLRLTEDGTT
jgi:ABC-2 type transport system ATP-binding protein